MFYLITLLVYGAVDVIACRGLSQQFGVAGVTNFGFIIFQAAGAYVAASLALPSDTANGGYQIYIGGLHLPFPMPLIGAALAGGPLAPPLPLLVGPPARGGLSAGAALAGALLALPFTFLVGRRLRGDFAAVGLLVTAVLLNLLVTDYRPLFNGDAGVAQVPGPLQSGIFILSSTTY